MKNIKILLVSIVSILCICFIAEFTAYKLESHRLVKEGYRFVNDANKPPYPKNIEMFSSDFEKKNKCEILDDKKGLNYKKNSILVFGDIYAKSLDLSNDNNLTAKLSDLTKRPVYNFASAGWGIQHMYYLLKNEEYLSCVKNPDTIIFVYSGDMKNRLASFSFYPHHTFLNLKYKLSDGVLVEQVPKALFAYNSYFVRVMERLNGIKKSKSKNPQIQQKNFELIKILFEQSRRVANVRYPDVKKFIIFRYVNPWDSMRTLSDEEGYAISQLEYNMWKKLQEEGFTVIDITELSDNNYNDGNHLDEMNSPTEETLDELLPLLVEKADL